MMYFYQVLKKMSIVSRIIHENPETLSKLRKWKIYNQKLRFKCYMQRIYYKNDRLDLRVIGIKRRLLIVFFDFVTNEFAWLHAEFTNDNRRIGF